MNDRTAVHPMANQHQAFLAGFAAEALKRLGVVVISEIISALRSHEKASVPSGVELQAYRTALAHVANGTTPAANDNR